jgi:hypothetical protein
MGRSQNTIRMNPQIPVIRVEIEGIRQQMHYAFSNYTLDLNNIFQEALTRALDPVAIEKLINDQAEETIAFILKAQVKDFFTYGAGYKTLRACIDQKLTEQFGPLQPDSSDDIPF